MDFGKIIMGVLTENSPKEVSPMKKREIWTGIVLVFLLAAVSGVWVPFLRADSAMPADGVLTLRQQEDGGWLLSWPEADRAEGYLVEVFGTEETADGVLFSATTDLSREVLLPELEGDLTLRIRSAVRYSIFGMELTRYGTEPLEVSLRLAAPRVKDLEWNGDGETRTLYVSFQLENADACSIYRIEGPRQYLHLETVTENYWSVSFGEDRLLPFPELGEDYGFAFAASRKVPGAEIYGAVAWEFSMDRQALLGTDLQAKLTPEEDYGFVLTWEETRGDYYEVQQLDETGRWTAVCRIELGEQRRYESGPLEKFSNFDYRVVALNGHGEITAQTEPIRFETQASPMYATVWPVKDLEAYYDTKSGEVYSGVKAGKAYCVVDEKDGFFGVRIGDQIGYIDSDYCMINLPDYMGQLCSYVITNSTGSIYKIHDLDIPNVTGVVTGGYENIRQADGSDLVPLLYPTAKKLVRAAQAAAGKGYRLRIYDSFRPQTATLEIYDRTAAVLNQPVPGGENGLTYQQMMLDGRYALTAFLAKGTSRHNLGVALDLTLESLASGKEVVMQSAMHDLSWHSVTGRNNANAKTLSAIMAEAGFTGLSTEWWHFQDDASKNQLQLTAVRNGVSAEGWTCDAVGWRYRDARGNWVQDQTLTLDGNAYTFDGQGYLTEGEPAYG